MLTCLWEKLAKEEVSFSSFSSVFCWWWWLWTKRNGPRRNVSWLLHNCPLFFLGKITKLLCTAENLQSWKKDHKNNFGYSSLAKQLEFISWKVNQFLWVSTKPCKAMKSSYIGSNVIITLLSFFLLCTTKWVWFVPTHICHICYIVQSTKQHNKCEPCFLLWPSFSTETRASLSYRSWHIYGP